MRWGLATAAVLVAARVAAQPATAGPPPAPPVPHSAVKPVLERVQKPVAKPEAAKTLPSSGLTPNAARVVSIGAIDKRTGVTKTYTGSPGQMFSFGTLTVTVRSCETTPPWEQKLTGAFLLIDDTIGRAKPRRIYSGWMFGESPSLHPLEHARYDIWVKSCEMRFPDTGPDTVTAGSVGVSVGAGGAAGDADKPKISRAKKSAVTPSAVAN